MKRKGQKLVNFCRIIENQSRNKLCHYTQYKLPTLSNNQILLWRERERERKRERKRENERERERERERYKEVQGRKVLQKALRSITRGYPAPDSCNTQRRLKALSSLVLNCSTESLFTTSLGKEVQVLQIL